MNKQPVKIGVVAPACRLYPVMAEKITAFAAESYPDGRVEIMVHPQCFLEDGHFAGDDAARAAAFLEVANDPTIDAVWFARGGYGSCRILEAVIPHLAPAAKAKRYLGYSDLGSLMGALYRQGFKGLAHGPMVADLKRPGGETAVRRALAWLVDHDPTALEPSLTLGVPAAAFNITILSALLGTPFEPDLTGHVLMLEEVAEPMYRIDRSLFHITSNPMIRRVAGLRLGRCSDVPANDPDFGRTEEQVTQYWCEQSGIAYLGRADIGHDVDNRVVPFG
jgi:muramoyltetrapeptide carboxypeptidase